MASALPATIRATVHQDAINKASRFFNASVNQTLNELFQNSRRANATRVCVTVEDGVVTVEDDGDGIPDPQNLLSFGLSGWDETTAHREDPAGMGIFSLSRYPEVNISTVCRDGGPAWSVTLDPDHFLGKSDVPVTPVDADGRTHGTTVSFTTKNATPDCVNTASLYYPLPVTCNGDPVRQKDFLAGAEYVEEWHGIRFGVYRPENLNSMDDMLNFHGLTVDSSRAGLPHVSTLDGIWNVRANVVDCPSLELALPARSDLVQTPFIQEMARAARRAVYRAILASDEPVDVPFSTQADARKEGIELPDAQPMLRPWQPSIARYSSHHYRRKGRQPFPDNAIVVKPGLDTPDEQCLYRAAQMAGIENRLYTQNPALDGFEWYNQVPAIVEASVSYVKDGQTHSLQDTREKYDTSFCPSDHVDSITFSLIVIDRDEEREMELPCDVAFPCDDTYLDDVSVLIARKTDLAPDALSQIMMDAWFDPSDDHDSDSYETQEADAERQCLASAMAMLLSEDESIVNTVQDLVTSNIAWHIPHGRSAIITVGPNSAVKVRLSSRTSGSFRRKVRSVMASVSHFIESWNPLGATASR